MALENEELIGMQIDTCIHNMSQVNQDKKLILNTSDNVFVVQISQLIHCEANENYSNIYLLGKEKITLSKPLKEFEEMLSVYGFFRIHQSHLINMQYVESVDKKGSGAVLLKTGEKLPLSQRKKQAFMQALKTMY